MHSFHSYVCRSICAFILLCAYDPLCQSSVNMQLGRLHFLNVTVTGFPLPLLLSPLASLFFFALLAIRAWQFQKKKKKRLKNSKNKNKNIHTKAKDVGFANGAAPERDKFLKLGAQQKIPKRSAEH